MGELLDVLFNRSGEMLQRAVAAVLSIAPDAELAEECREHGDPTGAVTLLLEHALLERGWRLAHPAVRDILVSPTGVRLATGDLAARSVDDRQARDEVLALLTGG
jgi:hypothetical protein